MTITIKDAVLDREVRALADELGESLVGAIRVAVQHERRRLREPTRSILQGELDELVAAATSTRVRGASAELEWGEFGEPL